MAFNFDSGQFNKESTPKRLGNWEVPRWAPTRARPLEMRPDPKPICDINGHFLPGAPRGSSRCFGHYTGTWDLPKNITRKVAEELAKEPPDGRFPDWINLRVQRPKAVVGKATTRVRGDKRGKAPKDTADEDDQSFKEDIYQSENNVDKELHSNSRNTDNNNDPLQLNERLEPVDSEGHGPYVPGSITEPDKRHESYDILVKDAVEKLHGPQENETDKFWRKVAESAKYNEQNLTENMKYAKKSDTPKLPFVNVSKNFNFAKSMHSGNLEHQPLPDTLGYRHLSKVGEHRDSDIVVKPYAIGWKGYGASGPTCCTKMRVHRPKTCDAKKTEAESEGHRQRPATSGHNLGGQYKKPLSLMDLAICWDFKTDDTRREPKPPKHIDGSNGSMAPAVFTVVATPKDELQDNIATGHSHSIFNQNRNGQDIGHHSVPYFEKDMAKEKRKDVCDVQNCPQHEYKEKGMLSKSSSRKNSGQSSKNGKCDGINGCGTPPESNHNFNGEYSKLNKLQNIKEAWSSKTKSCATGRRNNSLESYDKTPLAQGKLQHSSPNESQISRSPKDSESSNNVRHRHCYSCSSDKAPKETKHKEDYKFAFKAGNPNSVQSGNSSNDSKGVKMPKMRHPYTKKSYTIPTLAPPFSIWRDANATGYPEHWRLASVYQHAYKPPDQRRKPLINSVYQ